MKTKSKALQSALAQNTLRHVLSMPVVYTTPQTKPGNQHALPLRREPVTRCVKA